MSFWLPPLFLSALGLLLLGPSPGGGSNILVVPVDGSHWLNMKDILRELHSRGHNITVLRSAKSWFIPANSSIYTSVNVMMLEDEADRDFTSEMMLEVMECRRAWLFPTIRQQQMLSSRFDNGHRILAKAAGTMLDDPEFIKRMRDTKFDLMLTDPGLSLGVILGNYLKLPMVYNVRWINGGEGHSTIAPSPVSYVPVPGSELHDKMDFWGRTLNFLHYLFSIVEYHYYINPPYTDLLRRHFPPGTDLLSLQYAGDIWLLRTDWVFEFPRPTMPNVVYIGGFQCKEAKPLSAELESFMQSSGEHGVVVMSLGTLVQGLPREITEAIAAAFARLPQKVVWKYDGESPAALGNNTRLEKWLPQKDLLGHPKTRAFVAHGGTNGMYEAICHGVPVVGLPLLFDQFDNLVRMTARGAGRMVEARLLTEEIFYEALRDVLGNPTYKSSIQHMSRLLRDQPVSQMDRAIFWIEYVIRHKGASHLKAVGTSLPWYTYFCLDVVFFLMALFGAFVWASFLVCRLLCRRLRRKLKAE